ncbi:hypothetical protein ACQPUZ_10430 [Clostridium tertium]
MQNTTADYKLEINKPSRSFECKVTIGDNIYKNEDIVDIILEYTQPQDGFSIGNTVSQTLDLTLINKGDTIYSTSQIKLEIGLKIGSTIEYIPMGIFNIDDVEKTDYTTKFTCYDNMIKFEKTFSTSLGETLTLQQVVNELTRITGVEFTGSLPAYTVKKLDGFSCREVLSYVSSICGGNAVITRDGKFTIKSLGEVNKSIDGNNYITYTKEEIKYKIGQISCQVDENNILSKGSLGTDSMELQFENPWVNETILTDIYNKLNGLSYLGYSMKWQGDLSLDPYDVITVTDKKGVVRKEPILSYKITYTGGLTSEIGAKGETKNKNSFSSSGSTANKVNRAVMELAVINQALIDKANIRDLEAVSIRTQTLEAKTAKIEEAIIDVAHIKDLNAINASIENLIAADANITKLIATKADITDLTATNIKFNVGTGGTLDLQTLLSKFVTGENGQFLNITSSNVVIANATIKDAMIENLSLNKLKAGTISTNKFNIASDDGGITIVGPTMQFKDKSNKVRIQMGQDTQGNFNFILRGADGTTTLIDHTGIKEKAIADDLIKSNMVAADAIGEKQINYSSLITGLNKDTNTSLIQASKVAIDLTGQSLEVAFNSLKSDVDGINSTVKNNTTSITAAQGKIEGLIKESTITKGDITTLKDNYTSIKATVDGINTTVASHTSSITTIKNTADSALSNANTANSKIDGLEIGGRNLVINSPTLNNAYAQLDAFRGTRTIVDDSTAKSKKHIKIECTTTGTGFYFNIWSGDDSCIGKKYTWSFEAKMNTTKTLNNIGHERGGRTSINVTTEWKKFYYTWTYASAGNKAFIFYPRFVVGDIIYIRDFMIEEGTKASSWVPAPEDTNSSIDSLSGKVTTVENKQATLSQSLEGFKTTVANTYSTKTELSNLSGTVSSINSRVSTAESSITQLNNKIDLKVESTEVNSIVNNAVNNVQIGVRNYIKDYQFKAKDVWKKSRVEAKIESGYGYLEGSTENPYLYQNLEEGEIKKDDVLTLQYEVKFEDVGTNTGANTFLVRTQLSGYLNNGSYVQDIGVFGKHESDGLYLEEGWQKVVKTITITSNAVFDYARFRLYARNFTGKIYFRNIKLEKGNKASDLNSAPEDIDSAISTVDTKIETTNNKVATIETSLSSITQRVSSTESNISTINGNVSTLQSRMSSAESKITSSAIISTVQATINNAMNSAINSANSATDSKLQNYATKASMELTSTQLRLDFSSSGGYNLVKNGCFLNDRTHWGTWGSPTLSVVSSTGGYGKCIKITTTGTNQGIMQQVDNLQSGKTYTLSAYVKVESGVTAIQINNNNVTWHNAYSSGTGSWQWLSVTFNANSTFVNVEIGRNGGGSNGIYYYTAIMLQEGSIKSAYSPNPDEVYSGNTIIDANGVTIYNGALTVKNNAGQIVLQGDSNGDLTFKGKLQPNDYQVKLFGNDCKIDGSAGAIRMQWNPQTYVSVEDPYIRTFNKYSASGTNYGSIGVNSEGHFTIFGQRTMLKLLGNNSDTAIVQARWTSDTDYAAFAGSDFLNRSTIKDKTNVEEIEGIDFSKILLENNIFKYNLKTDVESVLNKFGLDEEYNSDEVVSSSADTKLGFILEELTEEAKLLLNPYDEDAISVYSMCSILWKVCQEQQKRIEVLESKVI